MEEVNKVLLEAGDEGAPGNPICFKPLTVCMEAWLNKKDFHCSHATQEGSKGNFLPVSEVVLFIEREGGKAKTVAGMMVCLPSEGKSHTGILTSLWTQSYCEAQEEGSDPAYSRQDERVDRLRRAGGKVTDAILRSGGEVMLGYGPEVRQGMREEAAKEALKELNYDVFASETGEKGIFFARCEVPKKEMLIPLEKDHVQPGLVIVQKHLRGKVIQKDRMGGGGDWIVRWMDGSEDRSETLFGKGALLSLHAEVEAWEEEDEEAE